MISNDSMIIKRHKNPLGIFLRILIYPAIAYGIWMHSPFIILIGLVAETLNWTVMPPIKKTLPFLQNVIDMELRWLNAENSATKKVSITLFGLFPIVISVGLWLHSGGLVVAAFAILIAFNILMQRIADSTEQYSK